MEEEPNGGRTGDWRQPETLAGDRSHELINLGACLGVEIIAELMMNRHLLSSSITVDGAFGNANKTRDKTEAKHKDTSKIEGYMTIRRGGRRRRNSRRNSKHLCSTFGLASASQVSFVLIRNF